MNTTPQHENVVPVPPVSVPAKKRLGPKPRRSDEERIAAIKAAFTSTSAPGRRRGPKVGSKNNPAGRAGKKWLTEEYWNKRLAKQQLSVSEGKNPKLVYVGITPANEFADIIASYAVNAATTAGQAQLLTPRRDEDGTVITKPNRGTKARQESPKHEGKAWREDIARANEFDEDPDHPNGEKGPNEGAPLFSKDDESFLHPLKAMWCRECKTLKKVIGYAAWKKTTAQRVICSPTMECGHMRHGEVLQGHKPYEPPIKGATRRVPRPSHANPTRPGLRVSSAERQYRAPAA